MMIACWRGVFTDFYQESADMLRLVTGWDVTASELRQTARRIVATKKLFNIQAGWTPGEDTLPPRMLQQALSDDVEARPITPTESTESSDFATTSHSTE